MSIVAEALLARVWPTPGGTCHLMVSGGADSMTLLFMVAEWSQCAPRTVLVHHCHHGVSSAADRWASMVCEEAERLGFSCQVHELGLSLGPDFEARARAARYGAVAPWVQAEDVVMTAHHQDDQLETLMLRLMAGSGWVGLVGIPVARPFGQGRLIRPLLQVSRRELRAWMVARNLRFITDGQNQELRLHRNLVRYRVLPALSARIPGLRALLLALSARAAAEVERARAALGALEPGAGSAPVAMAESATLIAWQVRLFAKAEGLFPPSSDQLAEFARQCLMAPPDRCPEVLLDQGRVAIRRWQGRLYWVDLERLGPAPEQERVDALHISAHSEQRLMFPTGELILSAGPEPTALSVYYGVRRRRFRLSQNRPLQSLKQIGKTLSVPPWLRPRVPLIAHGDQVLGWGAVDARIQGLIPYNVRWQWILRPRQNSQSPVS